MKNRHTFRLLVDPRPGIMIRTAMVLERRGYIVTFMELAEMPHSNGLFEMIIKAYGDIQKLEQTEKQLEKIIDVANVEMRSPVHVERPSFAVDKALA